MQKKQTPRPATLAKMKRTRHMCCGCQVDSKLQNLKSLHILKEKSNNLMKSLTVCGGSAPVSAGNGIPASHTQSLRADSCAPRTDNPPAIVVEPHLPHPARPAKQPCFSTVSLSSCLALRSPRVLPGVCALGMPPPPPRTTHLPYLGGQGSGLQALWDSGRGNPWH